MEPWGFHARDLFNGTLASIFAASAGMKDASASDFMLGQKIAEAAEEEAAPELSPNAFFDLVEAKAKARPKDPAPPAG